VDEGCTVVMSSHRVDEIYAMCHQRVGLQRGRLSSVERVPAQARAVVRPLASRAT
jgi:ABC-type multidrug transport system ATPase subunit